MNTHTCFILSILCFPRPDGFDPTAAYCNGIYPPNKDGDNASCFNHNWETPEARQRLWASCFQPGREVTRLFVSDMENRVVFLGKNMSGQCDAPLLALLSEAHELGIRVYALYSFDEPLITFAYPKQFNYHCGTSEAYFDGVAADSTFPGCNANIVDQQAYLDKLQDAVSGAAYTSPLPLHASVSWDWDCDLLWPAVDGATKSVVEHITGIVDSVDVQVASIENSAIVSRSMKPYQYWNSKVGKSDTSKVYVTAYTNPTEECQTSYSPHIIGSDTVEDNCPVGNPRTQAGMYQGFDDIESQLPLAKGAIYSMNEVYGSGVTAGWPVHLMPNPAPASCSGVSGQCSDGTGLCSETDLSGCTCARRRNLLDQTKSSQARQHVKLRGSEIARPAQRKLAKPVKSPPVSTSWLYQYLMTSVIVSWYWLRLIVLQFDLNCRSPQASLPTSSRQPLR